jgi:DNA-binding IclR family transcriptional regulator
MSSNYTAWALDAGRKITAAGEPLTFTLVLVAFAQEAAEALTSPSGYTGTSTHAVAARVGVSNATVQRYVKTAQSYGLLNFYGHLYRLPEAVLQAA